MSARALVVDDAPELREAVAAVLAHEGYAVELAPDGRSGLALARERAPELVVLDLALPDLDGIEVCRALRSFSDAYVVMLTARAEEVDKLIGLAVGADDYVTKPFSPRELAARVRALRRRPRAADAGAATAPRRVGALELDLDAREVRLAGAPVALTRTEFDLLDALSERPRAVLTRSALLERVWGPTWFGDEHVVAVHVSKLRAKLGDRTRTPPLIATVRGVGYRLDA